MARPRKQAPQLFFDLVGRVPDEAVARACGVSPPTVGRWRRLFDIPVVCLRGRVALPDAWPSHGGLGASVRVTLPHQTRVLVASRARRAGVSTSAWLRELVLHALARDAVAGDQGAWRP